jgi:hypothetical protein
VTVVGETLQQSVMSRQIAEWMGYGPGRVLDGFMLRNPSESRLGDVTDNVQYAGKEDCWQSSSALYEEAGHSAELREFLRRKGFLVELKGMPDGYPFRSNGEPSMPVSAKRFYCRCYPVASAMGTIYEHMARMHGFGDTEEQAVLLAAYQVLLCYRDHERKAEETLSVTTPAAAASPDCIPLDQCVARHVYRVKSRNLTLAVFDGKNGFIGIRVKFENAFLFREYHWDISPYATVRPIEDIGLLDALVFGGAFLRLTDSLPYTYCNWCGDILERPPLDDVTAWKHSQQTDCPQPTPSRRDNAALFAALKELD